MENGTHVTHIHCFFQISVSVGNNNSGGSGGPKLDIVWRDILSSFLMHYEWKFMYIACTAFIEALSHYIFFIALYSTLDKRLLSCARSTYMFTLKKSFCESNCVICATVHTMNELKLTGNCLRGSRPLLSFDPVSHPSLSCTQGLPYTHLLTF